MHASPLARAPLAPLLARLFANDAQPAPAAQALFAGLRDDERMQLMQSRTRYRELYGHLKDVPLAVSPETGRLLYMLARSARARTAVEFGTSFGVSTLHLAAALRDNGGGLLVTSEFEASKAALARAHLEEAGLADLVEIRIGDALQTLASKLPDGVDLLLLDGAKGLYPDILDLVEPHLRPGAFVVADNADYSPDYLARVRAPDGGYLSVPFGAEVELSMRLG